MTPEQIAAEYLRREREAHATLRGADCRAILTALAEEVGMDYAEAREIILDHTTMGPC
jgi:predicted DsbA family dithiol-disulfide isomerase